jgi:hypothetical protein
VLLLPLHHGWRGRGGGMVYEWWTGGWWIQSATAASVPTLFHSHALFTPNKGDKNVCRQTTEKHKVLPCYFTFRFVLFCCGHQKWIRFT